MSESRVKPDYDDYELSGVEGGDRVDEIHGQYISGFAGIEPFTIMIDKEVAKLLHYVMDDQAATDEMFACVRAEHPGF